VLRHFYICGSVYPAQLLLYSSRWRRIVGRSAENDSARRTRKDKRPVDLVRTGDVKAMNTLQVNPTTGEVFLRLSAPHENIIITPPRDSDAADITLILNDPRVYKNLLGPPFPYLPQHAEEWLRTTKDKSDKILEDLREGRTVVDGCPVQHIREVRSDGTDLFLGDLSVRRNDWLELEDEELREKMMKVNSERPVGDPSIVWTLGGTLQSAVEILR